ncbi:hypothetical protein L2E82_10790 [Cichorium intybus]|uniref:Uncharacterized protein n=1 Tax=Cichorium intybus TaxID=13427 RepID=A0ACB9GBH7_CICIN|nr:hypothetical protein L2E82_10790 [Cichorium intybus]
MWVSMIAAVGSIRAEAKPKPKIVVDRMRVEWGDKEGSGLRALKLFNTGNVALIEVASGNKLWQSFNAPTDTFLPGMKFGTSSMLTSWKSLKDPGTGSYEFRQDQGTKRYFILKDKTYHWKSGSSLANSFDESPFFSQALDLLSNTTTRKRWRSVNNTLYNETYMVIEPYSSCMRGFQPTLPKDYTAGCKRTTEICHNTKDTFVNLTMITLVLLSLGVLTYICYKRLVNRVAGNTQQSIELQSSNMRRVIELLDPDHSIEDDTEGVDVPYFELDTLIAATQDFSEKNKLGQGGFGPVYKAWSLWTEQKPQELMDQTLMESCNPDEVLKCIIIGLLCVQAQPDDRPSMENVIVMLGGEIYTLPTPKEPTVISGRDHATPSSSGLAKPDTQTKNMLEITELDGR